MLQAPGPLGSPHSLLSKEECPWTCSVWDWEEPHLPAGRFACGGRGVWPWMLFSALVLLGAWPLIRQPRFVQIPHAGLGASESPATRPEQGVQAQA